VKNHHGNVPAAPTAGRSSLRSRLRTSSPGPGARRSWYAHSRPRVRPRRARSCGGPESTTTTVYRVAAHQGPRRSSSALASPVVRLGDQEGRRRLNAPGRLRVDRGRNACSASTKRRRDWPARPSGPRPRCADVSRRLAGALRAEDLDRRGPRGNFRWPPSARGPSERAARRDAGGTCIFEFSFHRPQ